MRIIPYTPDRQGEVLRLLDVCLGKKPSLTRDAAYWNWKHEQNPFGRSLILLAENGGRIVGVRAFLRWQFLWQGRSIAAAKPVDTVTAPAFRKRGVFTELTRAACHLAEAEGVELLFNTPNKNSFVPYLRLGWRDLGSVPVTVRLWRPLRMVLRSLRLDRQPESPAVRGPSLQSFARDVLESDRIEAFLSVSGASTGLATPRSLTFLRWRYGQHPQHVYYAKTAERDGALTAVLFYRINVRRGLREILVDDILLRDPAQDTLRSLWDDVQRSTEGDYSVAHGWGGERLTRRAGVPVPWRGPRLVARTLGRGCAKDPRPIGDWALTLGDLEGL